MQKILDGFGFSKLAIACSGGIDSMCLAHLAVKETEVTALIIDHGLRTESSSEALQAKQTLDSLSIPNHIIKIEVSEDGNTQENARLARYEAMANWCKENSYDTIATGHHADDNAENFLLRLMRGSGVDGLAKMRLESEMFGIKIIRPLLNHTKKSLREILENAQIDWVEDASNAEDKYSRNKLRHTLEKLDDCELITSRINEVSENMQRVKSYLHEQTEAAEDSCVDYSQMELDIQKYKGLHEEIAFRLLTKTLLKLSPIAKTPRFEKIKNLHQAILSGNKKTIAGLIFSAKDNKILIELEK